MQVSYNPVKHPDRPYFYDVDGQPVGKVATAYIVTSATIDTKAKTRAYIRRFVSAADENWNSFLNQYN